MKLHVLIFYLLLNSITNYGQKDMNNRFVTWDNFVENFGKEMVISEDVYQNMVKNGLKDNSLIKMDFTFTSDKKDSLIILGNFLRQHYGYEVDEIEVVDDLWELSGVTYELPITAENLLYWALDMYKRGYEFDAKFVAYGGLVEENNFPYLDKSQEDFYFDKAMVCYENSDLSGAIINWTLVLEINPIDPNSYYSRAIVKNELYTWKSALKDYDKAIELAPDFISAIINRGSVKDENDDFEGAIEDYNTVLSFEDLELNDKQMAYFNRGNSKYNLDDKSGACEDWTQALKIGAEYAQDRLNEFCK